MPRTLKRRSDHISRDDSPGPMPGASQRRRRSPSPSSASGSDAELSGPETQGVTQSQTDIQVLSKKLIRLALSCEYSRIPLRRSDITQKIFKDSNASHRLYKPVFAAAQSQLRSVFGMQLVQLPNKEKTSLKDRRTQATQTQPSKTQTQTQTQKNNSATNSTASGSTKSYILTSTLPASYKHSSKILVPTHAPTPQSESSYTAFYTLLISLIYLNNGSLPEAKMERYLKRMNSDTYTSFGSLEETLKRMIREGYIERRRDATFGEEVVEYVVGPRGKVEVGAMGVAGLVRCVYGHGAADDTTTITGEEEADDAANGDVEPTTAVVVKMEKEELERRLQRSLGEEINKHEKVGVVVNDEEMVERGGRRAAPKRGRRRRDGDDDDSDD